MDKMTNTWATSWPRTLSVRPKRMPSGTKKPNQISKRSSKTARIGTYARDHKASQNTRRSSGRTLVGFAEYERRARKESHNTTLTDDDGVDDDGGGSGSCEHGPVLPVADRAGMKYRM
eukprot:927749-Amphidinium_carterae.3